MGVRYEKLKLLDQRRYEKYWKARFHRITKDGRRFRWRRKMRCWWEWEPRGHEPRKITINYNFPLDLNQKMLTRPIPYNREDEQRMSEYDIWYIDRFGHKQISRRHYNEILKRVLGAVGA